jgi:hypothetical protein
VGNLSGIDNAGLDHIAIFALVVLYFFHNDGTFETGVELTYNTLYILNNGFL